MKRKKLVVILGVALVVMVVFFVWWNVPSSLTNISPSEVSKIEFFDGGTGNSITVADAAEIKHIINNLNAVSVKKRKVSLGYLGYSFKTTIYRTNGAVYKTFMINSNDSIRKDPFFYHDSSESIDYRYIQVLFDKRAG